MRPKAYSEGLKVRQEIVFDNPRVIGLGEAGENGSTLVLTDALNRAISAAGTGAERAPRLSVPRETPPAGA